MKSAVLWRKSISTLQLSLACLGALGLLASCRGGQEQSEPQYLTSSDYTCATPSAARLADVQNRLPPGFVKGYPSSQMPVVYNRLSLIPDLYLNYLIANFKSGKLRGIYPGWSFFGVVGLTTLSAGTSPDGRPGMVATSITTSSTMAGFALQHEIGHAVEIVAIDSAAKTAAYQDFDGSLSKLYREVLSRPDTRSYAKSSSAEAWAESFASFYCSPDSYAYIQQNLPFTNGFLTAVLAPQQWAGGVGSASSTDNAVASGTNAPAPTPSASTNTTKKPSLNPFQSFIDKILAFFHIPAMNADEAIAGASAQPDGNIPAGGAADISLALQDIPGAEPATGMIIAARQEIKQVVLCIGQGSDCVPQQPLAAPTANSFLFNNFVSGQERNFFSIKTLRQDQEAAFGSPWHLSGYDAKGNLLVTRSLRISAAQ